jgi:hypothetical protein
MADEQKLQTDQLTDTPAEPEAQAADSATTPADTGQGSGQFDITALESELSQLAGGYSLKNIVAKTRELQERLTTKGREHAELNRQYETVKPLIDATRQDPRFRAAIDETVRSYYGQAAEPAESFQSPSPPPTQGQGYGLLPNPDAERLANLEMNQALDRANRDLDAVEKSGLPMDDVRRGQVVTRMLETGNFASARDTYYALYGEELLANRGKDATAATATAIAANSATISPTPAGGEAPKDTAPDVAAMSMDEWQVYKAERIRKAISGGG